MARLILLALLASCGPPPPAKGPPPPRVVDKARGISFDPPAPPFVRKENHRADSVAHFVDDSTRAGIHVLAFADSGATDEDAAKKRGDTYARHLEESVAGLQLLGKRHIERFGLHGIELEYDGTLPIEEFGVELRVRSIDWIFYAPGFVYVIKVIAPAAKFAEVAAPLFASRATLKIEPR
jgi:hypothetical protein